jgi:lysine-specific demethylase/histidyl-hydroxylase NO66
MQTPSTRTPARPTPAPSAARALGRAVEPVSVETFLDDHWERLPLVVERGGRSGFEDLLSEADVERLVTSGGLRHPAFRLAKAGERLRLRDYSTDISWRPEPFAKTADAEAIAAAFADGATIIVQGMHHWWPALSRFCRELEAELGHPAQANAYYTPRDSQGLPVHHDTHDVFVLQVAGEKRWLVYEPVLELPLRDQRYDSALGTPGEPVHDVVLRAGDTMYLPRGWLHQAVTSETDSLHLTIGVNVYPWIEAVRAALAECADDVEFRRSVPADGEGGRDLLDALAERLDPEAVAARTAGRFVDGRRPILDGQLAQLRALEEIDTGTRVERRPTVLALFEFGDGRVRLRFHGKTVSFPSRAAGEVEHLAFADAPTAIGDLPGSLDEDGRLVLVRRLVREGFLVLTDV